MAWKYELMLTLAEERKLIVKEKDLWFYDGLIIGNKVAIRKRIRTDREKGCVLAEEIGHDMTSSGNILDYADPDSRKQEVKARTAGYDLMIGLDGIIEAYEAGCRGSYEIADYLDCTEEYLLAAVKRYHEIYGLYQRHGDYVIYFEPALNVIKTTKGR